MFNASLIRLVAVLSVVGALELFRPVLADDPRQTPAPVPNSKNGKVARAVIVALIKELGDDSYAKREAASKRLAEIGEPALALLQKAALNSPDAEARLRAKAIARLITGAFFQEERRYEGHSQDPGQRATRVVVTSDGRFAVSAGAGKLRYWDVASGKLLLAFGEISGGYNYALSIAQDGKRVIAGGKAGVVRVFELPSGKQIQQFTGHSASIVGAHLLADGKRAVSGAWDRSIRLWSVETGNEILTFESLNEQVRCLAVSPDGKTLATASCKEIDRSPGLVRLWDIDTGKMLKVMEGHARNTSNVCFARDGKTLLSSGYDGTLRMWDLATGKELKKFEAAPQGIEAAAITPDGRHVLSGGNPSNPTLRMWEVASGKLVFESEEMAGGFLAVTAMPDSHGCMTATRDGIVRLWHWKR